MVDPDPPHAPGAPTHIHIEHNRQPGWFKALAWIALLAGLLALLLGLSHCRRQDTAAVTPAASPSPTNTAVVAETSGAPQSAALAGMSGLGTYLGGTEPTPRTFTFEKLNFDTAKSDIRPADQAEVKQIAGVLKQYPKAKIRIAGYADARGSDPANQALGKARADSVKQALVGEGVEAGRIDTVSGGEGDPVATNATAQGQFENRRTELVVTAR